MSIHAHTCVYMRVYVFLLCIPIRFFIWSNVGQTRHIISMGMKKASKRNLHIVKTSCWWMKAIIFQVFNQSLCKFTDKLSFLWHLLNLKLRKLKQLLGVPILTRKLHVFTRKYLMCFGMCRQVACEMFI